MVAADLLSDFRCTRREQIRVKFSFVRHKAFHTWYVAAIYKVNI
jgi:hypothetical protein